MTQAPAEAVPTGNTYDKYGSTNPVVRRLMAGFHRRWTSSGTWRAGVDPRRGLRRGRADRTSGPTGSATGRIVGIDLGDPKLQAEWEKRQRAEPRVPGRGRPTTLSFADDEFDMATAIEVLEHVPDPERTVAEMARVARSAAAGVGAARAAVARAEHGARRVLEDLGNTPGHVNHWSKRGFVVDARRVTARSRRSARRSRGRWCLSASLRIPAAPPKRRPRDRRLRTRRGDPVGAGSASPASSRTPTSRWRQPLAVEGRLRRASRCCGRRSSSSSRCSTGRWSSCCRGRSRPRRARADRQRAPARGGDDPARRSACCSRSWRSRSARRSRTTCFDGSTTLYWILIARCSATRRATSRAATSPGTGGSGSTAGSCSWSRWRAACSPSRSTVGIATGQNVVALGHGRGAAAVACRWCRGRSPGPARAPATSPDDAVTRRSRRGVGASRRRRRSRRARVHASPTAPASRRRCW